MPSMSTVVVDSIFRYISIHITESYNLTLFLSTAPVAVMRCVTSDFSIEFRPRPSYLDGRSTPVSQQPYRETAH